SPEKEPEPESRWLTALVRQIPEHRRRESTPDDEPEHTVNGDWNGRAGNYRKGAGSDLGAVECATDDADRRHAAIMLSGQVDRDTQASQRQHDDGGGQWRATNQRAHAVERAE